MLSAVRDSSPGFLCSVDKESCLSFEMIRGCLCTIIRVLQKEI